jgi:hypothetical protein
MLTQIISNWTEIVSVAAGAHMLALAVVNLTPTPKDDEIYGKIYRAVEILAGLVTKLAKK